ncbi:MAG TPA: DUF4382 domain-containing protein [Steroidobacteraceae bacterium]|jgi:hypothetical protein|nr:DUF4382 domain-containing protein [Steroidobacteraceae bacterium]
MNRRNFGTRRAWRALSLQLLTSAGLSGALLLAACSGGGGSMGSMTTPPPANANGVAMVTLTDQPGDFLSYMVNVVSLKLTRADGTSVETVPAATTVDFAQLVNLSEVISAQQVPPGEYTGVTLTLDYSSASIVVDNGAGGLTVPAANIINGATMSPLVSPNSQLTLTLQLPSGVPLIVTGGTISNLALDFNLSASDTVAPATISASTVASAVTVTVTPVLVASLTPDTSKQVRVRGPLSSVTNTSAQTSYSVTVWPFFTAAGNRGQITVYTTPSTAFLINGSASTGTAGLTALSMVPSGTLTLAYGTFDTTTLTFTAAQVFAGSSVPGAGLDSAEGTVISRSGDTFILTNSFLEPRAGADMQGGEVMAQDMGASDTTSGGFGHFARQLTVTVATGTMVTEDGQSGTFGPQDISVGQHLQAFGTFGMSAGGRTLDASAGSVRLMVTPLWGQFTSAAGAVATLNLESLDGRDPSLFNFAGTGTSSANDASAAAYTVSVPATLSIPTLNAGFPIAFSGFVTPFGSAPPDFAALSLENFTSTNGTLLLGWAPPGSTAPFVAPLSATNVMMTQATLEGAAVHVIRLGPTQFDPSTVSAGLTFQANTSPSFMSFAIAHRMTWQYQTYSTFSDFITALSGDLNGTTGLLALYGEGPYDESTGVLSVNVMAAVLSD